MPKSTPPLVLLRNAMSLSLTAVHNSLTLWQQIVVQGCVEKVSNISNSSWLFSDKSAIRFIPRENGIHSIDVKFNGCHIPGSPFRVRVGDPGLIGDPGMVTAHGPGLQGGTTGKTFLSLYLMSCAN